MSINGNLLGSHDFKILTLFHLAGEAKYINRHNLINLLEIFNACLILCMVYYAQNMTHIKETQHFN